MRTRQEAESEARKLGLREGRAEWETAVDASMRGWPSWRIAQHFNMRPELIFSLGGPEAQNGDGA
jgi:hypothetical protein